MKNRIAKFTYFLVCNPFEIYKKIKRKLIKALIRSNVKPLNLILPWNQGKKKKCINGVNIEFNFKFSNAEKIYCYAYPNLKLTNLMSEFLDEGSTFIDIGANIGYFSALAMGHVGKNGVVYAFEPVGTYYDKLLKIKSLNKGHDFRPYKKALGETQKKTEIHITKDIIGKSSIGMNSLITDLIDDDILQNKEIVNIDTFDSHFSNTDLNRLKFIKIDVEGYEYFVLKGMEQFLSKTEAKFLIFCEFTPNIYEKLGISLEEIFEYMEDFGFERISIETIDLIKKKSTSDVVFTNSKEIKQKYENLKYKYWNY